MRLLYRALLLWILVAPAVAKPIAITPSPHWKNTLLFPDSPGVEPFLIQWPYLGGVRRELGWVKFVILLDDPQRVFFQDSNTFTLHYDFVSQELDPYLGISREAFDAASLREVDQEIALGAVLFPTDPAETREIGIQLVRSDPYSVSEVAEQFEAVRLAIAGASDVETFYLPSFDQLEAAEAAADSLADVGIVISSVARWQAGNDCYSAGAALGFLREVASHEVHAAYAAGELLPGDILLTDAIPAELPFLAGILTQSPTTPSSHVALQAMAFGIPFAHLEIPADAERAAELVDHEVVLRAEFTSDGLCSVRLIDVEGKLDDALREELLTLAAPPALDVQPLESFGALSASTDELAPEDIVFFGGKAANFGLLRDFIPENSPPAIAFSFDLWTAYMAQTLPGGGTLAVAIASELEPFQGSGGSPSFPPDFAALELALENVRVLIREEAEVPVELVAEIEGALEVFDPQRKIRFRSSTNVEDSDSFVGAGLYDSYSGCLADDLDGADDGPSQCDATRAKERGVYRAIRKVFASFYNTSAVLERLRHSVDESSVGMALLVHHSFPDEIELANGVASYDHSAPGLEGRNLKRITLVTQLGAESVTNPEGGAAPEVVSVLVTRFGDRRSFSLSLLEGSDRVPMGDTVLLWKDDYGDLAALIADVAEGFAALHPEQERFVLDFEYKKVEPGELVIKQVREIPLRSEGEPVTAYLVDEPGETCVVQGDHGSLVGTHRLKSRWRLESFDQPLDDGSLGASIYRDASFSHIETTGVVESPGPPSSWPDASFELVLPEPEADAIAILRDGFSLTDEGPVRTGLLETAVAQTIAPERIAIVSQRDLYREFRVSYDEPIQTLTDEFDYAETQEDSVQLGTCPDAAVLTERHIPKTLVWIGEGGISVQTTYIAEPYPLFQIFIDYVGALTTFVETRITGLTSEPIVLTGYYSQTYFGKVLAHHYTATTFLFEPRLEPGLPPAILAELEAQNIRAIAVARAAFAGPGQAIPGILALGIDGTPRSLAALVPNSDFDTIPNELDNCDFATNPDQSDLDGDGLGDACDIDCPGSGVPIPLTLSACSGRPGDSITVTVADSYPSPEAFSSGVEVQLAGQSAPLSQWSKRSLTLTIPEIDAGEQALLELSDPDACFEYAPAPCRIHVQVPEPSASWLATAALLAIALLRGRARR